MSSISLIIDSHKKKRVNSKGYATLNSNYFSLKKCVYVTEIWINICIKCWWNKFYRFVVKKSPTKTLENVSYSKERCIYYCYLFFSLSFLFYQTNEVTSTQCNTIMRFKATSWKRNETFVEEVALSFLYSSYGLCITLQEISNDIL